MTEVTPGNHDINPRQIAAIKRAKELSETVVVSYPQVADAYRQGKTIETIVDELGLGTLAGSRAVVKQAVKYAIQELIPDEEREQLNGEKKVETGKKVGHKLHEQGRGIHAQTLEDKQELARKNKEDEVGIFALSVEERRELGRKNYENKVGIHARTTEEKREEGKKLHEAGLGVHGKTKEDLKAYAKIALASRGLIPWEGDLIDPETGLNEFNYLKALLNDTAYLIKHKGVISPNRKKIAEKINQVFHNGNPVRTPNSVSTALEKIKESKQVNSPGGQA